VQYKFYKLPERAWVGRDRYEWNLIVTSWDPEVLSWSLSRLMCVDRNIKDSKDYIFLSRATLSLQHRLESGF